MQIDGLKIAGFKSFVDPVDFTIEDGLTGIVGPNGCGKSNILESLRWVMGATSARAMRGGEMDDLIFSGSAQRPQRESCEVAVVLDNTARTAPSALNDSDILEVRRRLRRGAGSTYKVNGRTVRAKDVQLLFADASTGANSPALVRQGQISELIGSKPQNRRRILEEAAGVSGLSARRHEAELKLRAAANNLEKLDDIIGEVEKQISSLKRQAGKARKHRELTEAIQALEVRLLLDRWQEAVTDLKLTSEALEAAKQAVQHGVRAEATAATREAEASALLPSLRGAETEAAGKLGALKMQLARLDGERQAADDAIERLKANLSRISGDQSREHDLRDEAQEKAIAAKQTLDDLPALDQATRETARARLLEAYSDARGKLDQLEARADKLAAEVATSEAEANTARQSLARASARLESLERDHAQLVSDKAKLGDAQALESALAKAQSEHASALKDAETAKARVSETEAKANEAAKSLDEAQSPLREAEQALNALQAEIAGLERIANDSAGSGSGRAVLDDVLPHEGLERALAAAIGDDLAASLEEKDPQFWSSHQSRGDSALPKGAICLWDVVDAPDILKPRLEQCGLIEAEAGPGLQAKLAPGQRLVSREGDLWRWDGYVRTAKAPPASTERLEQKTRLAARRKAMAKQEKANSKLRQKYEAAEQDSNAAREAARKAAGEIPEAATRASMAREAVLQAEQALERLHLRTASIDNALARLDDDLIAARASHAEAEKLLSGGTSGNRKQELDTVRSELQDARTAEREAHSALTDFDRESDRAEARRSALERELADWTRRSQAADGRLNALHAERDSLRRQITEAEAAPSDIKARFDALSGEIETAEKTRQTAAEALAEAETTLRERESESRKARETLAKARETLARNEARLESAERRRNDADAAIRARFDCDPADLERAQADRGDTDDEDDDADNDADTRERKLADLKRQLDALGPVNQEADEQLADTADRMEQQLAEREDLRAALDKLNEAVDALNAEGRTRLLEAFEVVAGHFKILFETLFEGGEAELRLTESDDPLQAGLEIFACPPGKRLAALSLMSGGEQALTATALIFAVFLSRPSPLCVLDEVDAPLDDANVDRYCRMLDEMRKRTETRFIVITHNPVTMSRMDRLYGVTMQERGVSKLVSVDLQAAERMAAAE